MVARKDQDFEMHQGDYKTPVFTVTDRDGNDVDITGMTLTWEMSAKPDSETPLITKVSTDSQEIDKTYGNTNQCIVYIEGSETTDFEEAVYYHELAVVTAASKPQVIAKGAVDLLESLIQ